MDTQSPVKKAGTVRRRRRFLVFSSAVVMLWMLAMQSGCLAFRTSDEDWVSKLKKQGQEIPPAFADARMPDGTTVHAVSIAQTPDLPLLVMVHGSPGSADAYLSFLADTLLTSQAHIISLDRPGFGYSSFGRPEPDLRKQAEAVVAVMDHLAPGKKALLVGHSLGAPVIVCLAMHFPDKVAGLVLVGGSVDPAQEPDAFWQKIVDNPPVKWLIPKAFWASNHEIMALKGQLEDMKPLWQEIRCPVALVHARNDRLVPFANVAFAKKMLTQAPVREMIFDKGDHFIIWSRHDTIRDFLLEWLDAEGQ